MKVCAKGCCVQKNFFVCNNMSEHNVRSETKQCYACVWSHKKKLGNFCCSIVPLNVNSNKFSEANHIEAMWITYIMMYASDNFLDHPKNLPCCIHHDGTRRVANSLRTILASSYKVVEAKVIYFFIFFVAKKHKKICAYFTTHVAC